MVDLYDAVDPLPARFNLCDYFLDRNLAERLHKVALVSGDETRTFAAVAERSRRVDDEGRPG